MKNQMRSCWGNCGALDDENLLKDAEISAIDALADSLGLLSDDITGIRGLITRFEMCYHEADKEGEMIIGAIAVGKPPVESGERPPQRQRDLQNTVDILMAWCERDVSKCSGLDVEGVPADELLGFLGETTPVKIWQVQRLIDKLRQSLKGRECYYNLVLNIDGYGDPIDHHPEEYYKDHVDFLEQTNATMIDYEFNGEPDQMSIGLAIDLFWPCNWNYADNLVVVLKAINGKLKADRVFAPCCFNKELTPLRGRLKTLSNTLKAFCDDKADNKDIDDAMLSLLGDRTDVKHWLAASLDKTIRLQQGFKLNID